MRGRLHLGRLRLVPPLVWVLMGVAAVPSTATAQTAQVDVTRLETECARLRAELARVNAEVAALKRSDAASSLGVRTDYRLRRRMADAEALARQLTAAEAELRARTARAPAPSTRPIAAPSAVAGDGPVELEAKADLLVDEARRLDDQAAALARSAGVIRSRQSLRRRADGLARDPFLTLEGPKRTLIFGGRSGNLSNPVPAGDSKATPVATAGSQPTGAPPPPPPPPPGQNPPPTAPPMTAVAPPQAPTPPAGATPAGPPATTTPAVGTPERTATTSGPGGTTGAQPFASVPTTTRTLLDPATLSEIQRLERTGRAPSDPDALDKMAAALRARARALEAEARAVRARPR